MTRDDARELLPAFAVGALDPDELLAVEDALHRYPELASELRAYSDAASALALPVAAPDALRARFLDAISNASNQAPAAGSAVEPGRPTLTVERAARADATRAIASDAAPAATGAKGARRSMVIPMLLALGLAASLFMLVQTRRDASGLREQFAAQSDSLNANRERVIAQDSIIDILLGADRAVLVVNLETPATTGPGVQFFWNQRTQKGLLHAYRLPPAPAGRVYQLWIIQDGKPVPSNVFTSDVQGRSVVSGIALPASLDGVSAVAITEEPEGGSAAPTTQPFLVGAIRQTG
jgi:hypothetical protein